MRDRYWPFVEKGKHWNYSDVASWRQALAAPWPSDPIAELLEVLKGGQVPLIGIPVQPNVLWPKERQEAWKERVGRGPKRDGNLMPTRIPLEYLAEVDLRVSAEGGETELWWNCNLLAWGCVYFARDELIRAYMAYFKLPPVASAAMPGNGFPRLLEAGDLTAATAGAIQARAQNPLVSKKALVDFLLRLPTQGLKKDYKAAGLAFPNKHVTRADVDAVRKEIDRTQNPPGKRPGT